MIGLDAGEEYRRSLVHQRARLFPKSNQLSKPNDGMRDLHIIYENQFYLIKKVEDMSNGQSFTQIVPADVHNFDISSMRHENILSIRQEDNIFVADSMEMTLQSYLQQPNLKIDQYHVIRQIINLIQFLHSQNLAHTELSTHNFLINDKLDIKAVPLPQEDVQYRAPERIIGWEVENMKSEDMFQLGCIILEILAQRPILESEDETNQMLKYTFFLGRPKEVIYRNVFHQLPETQPVDIDQYLIESDERLVRLLHQLLVYDPEKRATIEQVINYLNQVYPYRPATSTSKYTSPPSQNLSHKGQKKQRYGLNNGSPNYYYQDNLPSVNLYEEDPNDLSSSTPKSSLSYSRNRYDDQMRTIIEENSLNNEGKSQLRDQILNTLNNHPTSIDNHSGVRQYNKSQLPRKSSLSSTSQNKQRKNSLLKPDTPQRSRPSSLLYTNNDDNRSEQKSTIPQNNDYRMITPQGRKSYDTNAKKNNKVNILAPNEREQNSKHSASPKQQNDEGFFLGVEDKEKNIREHQTSFYQLKKIFDEEAKQKIEDDLRKKMEEEQKEKEEQQLKKLKEEQKKKELEEQKKKDVDQKKQEEEQKKKEEERRRQEEEKKKIEEERKIKDEEQKKLQEIELRKKLEEEAKKKEDELRKQFEEQQRKKEEELKSKDEEKKLKDLELLKKDQEKKKLEEELRKKDEAIKKQEEEEKRLKEELAQKGNTKKQQDQEKQLKAQKEAEDKLRKQLESEQEKVKKLTEEILKKQKQDEETSKKNENEQKKAKELEQKQLKEKQDQIADQEKKQKEQAAELLKKEKDAEEAIKREQKQMQEEAKKREEQLLKDLKLKEDEFKKKQEEAEEERKKRDQENDKQRQKDLEEFQKKEEMLKQKELDLEKQKKEEEEKQRAFEEQKKKELESQKEKQRELDHLKELELAKLKELEEQKKRDEEDKLRKQQEEEKRLQEIEKQKQQELQDLLKQKEIEKQKLRDLEEKDKELQRRREEDLKKMQEFEKQKQLQKSQQKESSAQTTLRNPPSKERETPPNTNQRELEEYIEAEKNRQKKEQKSLKPITQQSQPASKNQTQTDDNRSQNWPNPNSTLIILPEALQRQQMASNILQQEIEFNEIYRQRQGYSYHRFKPTQINNRYSQNPKQNQVVSPQMYDSSQNFYPPESGDKNNSVSTPLTHRTPRISTDHSNIKSALLNSYERNQNNSNIKNDSVASQKKPKVMINGNSVVLEESTPRQNNYNQNNPSHYNPIYKEQSQPKVLYNKPIIPPLKNIASSLPPASDKRKASPPQSERSDQILRKRPSNNLNKSVDLKKGKKKKPQSNNDYKMPPLTARNSNNYNNNSNNNGDYQSDERTKFRQSHDGQLLTYSNTDSIPSIVQSRINSNMYLQTKPDQPTVFNTRLLARPPTFLMQKDSGED